jgi:Xaa-Pro aminopeptidase
MGIIKNAHLPHMVGHGMGLEFHEIPRIMPNGDDILQSNMVFTIEPSIRVPGVGAIRFEEVYRLTENGVVKA